MCVCRAEERDGPAPAYIGSDMFSVQYLLYNIYKLMVTQGIKIGRVKLESEVKRELQAFGPRDLLVAVTE